ncbi:TolC family protein [Planctomycetales bacterium ZRK34]|nr:TolC family protein [Planctomycetales bacterium ZRK34]
MSSGVYRSGIVLILMLSFGCASPLQDQAWRTPRPLGAQVPTYKPPRTPTPHVKDDVVVEVSHETLTLAQAVSLTLLHHPRLQAAAWDVRIAEARSLQASLAPNPTGGVNVENFGGTGPLSGLDRSVTTLRIGQLIELAGKREKRTAVAEHAATLGGWDYEVTRLQVLVETTRRFIEVLADQHRVELAADTLRLAEEAHRIVADRVNAGVTPTADRDRSRVHVSQERIALQRARRVLENSRHQLAASWNSSEPRFKRVVGDLGQVSEVPTMATVMPLLQQNPNLARWDDEVAHRQAVIESERARGIPDVTVGPGVRYLNDSDEKAFVFEASMPFPIIDRNQGNVLAARYALAKAYAERRDAQRQVHEALSDAIYKLHASHREIEILRTQTVSAARSAFEAASQAFREGASDYTTVLDTERTYIDVRRQEIEALAEYQLLVNQTEGLIAQPLNNR